MEQMTVLVLAVGLLIGLATFFCLYQILKQQGRLLLRLDQVERHLGLAPADAIERGTVALQARSLSGLPVGSRFPDFELPDLEGRPVSLESFVGQKVLLIHWSARCGFCELIARDIAELEPKAERAGVRLLLVSHGPAEADLKLARENGLRSPILLQTSCATRLEAFSEVGTPAAYLLDEQGRVARPLAVGADDVPALARDLLSEDRQASSLRRRPLSESRIERNGLKAGTPAPGFTLPEVRGGTVSLEELRGRKLLLVFSDPHCGPCEQLYPYLAQLHREHAGNGLGLLVVGRGEPEANRSKAEEHGCEFPIAVQRGWEVSRRYGIFATPVGFLIDEEGGIARDMARGIEPILALAREAAGAGKEAGHVRAVR